MEERKSPFAKRSFGQNFLTDKNYIDKIIDAVEVSSEDTVVEIGPGRGALTEELIQRAGRVIGIELDRDMIGELETKFAPSENFEVISADALSIDYAAIERDAGRKLKLVANLPYYISTAILQRLIEQRHSFSEVVLMFQREVVDRITAEPGSTDRGYLTALVEAFLETRRLFDVPPAAFRPRPKVWSSVVKLTPKPDDPNLHVETFKLLVSNAFLHKRKTILNNLKSASPRLKIKPQATEQILSRCHIESNRRPETLTIAEWKCLSAVLAQASE
jgi:16S rRNA (adenine1518-N6/adenine1519-N6)-dimethyltransferase